MFNDEWEKGAFECIRELEETYPGCTPFLSDGNETYSCCICSNGDCPHNFTLEEKFESPGKCCEHQKLATTEKYLKNYNSFKNTQKETTAVPKVKINLAFQRRQQAKILKYLCNKHSK